MSHGPGQAAPDRLSPLLDQRLLPLVSHLVPRPKRPEWTREWQAELWHLRYGEQRDRRRTESVRQVLSLSWGLVADAGWVGLHSLKQEKRGSAQWCLYQLVAACLACGVVELICERSWGSLMHTFAGYFVDRFMLVALPATFVALATMPRTPRKCNRERRHLSGLLPEHTRWTLFLASKVSLSVTLGFLVCVLVSIPVRRVLGHNGDWIDVVLSTVMLTTSLRLSFDDQKQRCQRCLRLLSQPVRVGPPSYNLLNWNGTELVCSEGHGLLQVPEMQGSWCWYDLWVEVDPGWNSALSPES